MNERIVEGVRLSNPDKMLYPEQGISKSDLAEYHVAIADRILPHVAFRPITIVRCPTGRQKKCFYQRHAGPGIPRQIGRVTIPGFDNPYLYIRDLPGLIALVQIGVLEIHPWAVTRDAPDRPDRIIFDLDPAEDLGFDAVVRAALEVRERLEALGIASFAKTTGGKGLHVVVPIAPERVWPEVKSWAKTFSERMAMDSPELYLTKMAKAQRTGRIFIDYLRNDPTATAIAPYSTRSQAGAPVATPLDWSEVEPGLNPSGFTTISVPKRVSAQLDDPWAAMTRMTQKLPDLHSG